MNVSEILLDKLTPEQLFIVEIYKQILASNKKEYFKLETNFDEAYIDQSIQKAIEKSREESKEGKEKMPDFLN
jgi:hypothetical protein